MEQKLVNFTLPPAPLDEPETVRPHAVCVHGMACMTLPVGHEGEEVWRKHETKRCQLSTRVVAAAPTDTIVCG